MKLAKPCLDVALFTDAADPGPMLAYWKQAVGLPFEEALPTGGGNLQHRHGLNGSVLKLNHSRHPLPQAPPSGYRELWIAREGLSAPRELTDPDGNRVVLVPPGTEGIDQIGVRMAVRNADAFEHWFGEVLGLARINGGYACGRTRLFFEESPDAVAGTEIRGPGFRYLTIQVQSCDEEHAGILARGGREGAPPRTHGEIARYSMVTDPDGNWLEISQRASLTGSLD
ncbi:MAG: VOC family protein [Planctomycetota bacterium]|nr:bleomycin resistance protein [Deltaproteobacteria bacterium]MDP6540717.1 VOC family protein [Planctomycetota bacterium]